ncbi:MAG: FHA domain-containing protein [Pelolinea sp.]|nr:FHA domain-containing protein [Pelolinea sp.]
MAIIIKLVVKSGDEINKTFFIEKEKNTIGRDPKSDFVIDDIEISRSHLEIIKNENSVLLEDLNSTNGTFLNGKRLEKITAITDGDLISLGKNIVLEFIREQTHEDSEPLQNDELVQPLELEDENDQPEFREPLENDILEQETEFKEEKPQEKVPSKLRSKFQKMPTWVLILITALGFLVIFCIIPLLVIEVTDQWCNLFAGFFNSMSPGVCP